MSSSSLSRSAELLKPYMLLWCFIKETKDFFRSQGTRQGVGTGGKISLAKCSLEVAVWDGTLQTRCGESLSGGTVALKDQ